MPDEKKEDALNAATDCRSAVELGEAYLAALQAKDKQAILSLLSDDFCLIVPCNVSGTNDLSDSWNGLEAADANYDLAFRTIDVLQITDLEFVAGENPDIAFAEGLGRMKMFNGNPYCNRYILRFDAENGKLKRVREYLNPVTAALAFGLPLPQI